MAESIVSSLIIKLGSLIAEEGTFLLGVKEQLSLLSDKLECMRYFLKEAESKRRNSGSEEPWVSQIMELANEAEYVIDAYFFHVEQQKRRNFVKKLFYFGNKVMALHRFGNRIDGINKRAQSISECRRNYNLDTSQPEQESSSHRAENIAWRRRGISTMEESEIVGFTEAKAQLAKWLKDNEAFPSRKVISVTGMGGLGKTALARATFNRVSSHFDAKAWVTVSQEYQVRDLLLRILKEFTGDSLRSGQMDNQECKKELPKMETMDDDQLEGELRKQLESKRYLIVIDDIWRVEAWDRLNKAFPDNNKGGRILLTSRTTEVASHADPSRLAHLELKPLSKDESWTLFCKKVFSMPDDTNCPRDLTEPGQQIVDKCRGLPLAILVMGGLLMGKDRTVDAWSRVLKSATRHLSEDSSQVREILSLSYFDLPHYLRPCFLYLGIFPEDYKIYAQNLVLLWVAEGFIEAREEEKMEDVAEDYLEELIRRSMIQVTERVYYEGPVGVCRVHDLLRDLAISEGKKNKFLGIQMTESSTSTQHKMKRIAIHSNVNSKDHISETITPNLRSLLVFASGDRSSSDIFCKFTAVHGAKMLRVLELCNLANLTVLPEEIGNLILLHYLGLSYTKLTSLPSSIGKLVNLQTLYLRGDTYIGLPKAFWKLKKIRHFCAIRVNFDLKTSMHPMNTKFVQLKDFGRNLLTLRVGGDMYTCLLGMLVEVGCLRVLTVMGELSIHAHQSLKNCFPSSLTDLCLIDSNFKQDALDVFGNLPKLKTLELREAYTGNELVFSSGQFPQLQYLCLAFNDKLTDWRVEDGAISNLRHIHIISCKNLIKLPDRLKDVGTLRKLEICSMPRPFRARIGEKGEDWEIIKHVRIIVT